MTKYRFLIFASLLSLQCAMAVQQPSAISKPEWRAGQSWQVKCPIIVYGPAGYRAVDTGKSCTLTYSVLRKEKIGKSECWAVRISTGGDIRRASQTFYVYYRTSDLSLMTDPYTTDFFLGKDGAPIYKEQTAYPDISGHSLLIEMPTFPLVPGKDETRLVYDSVRDDHKQLDTSEDTILTMSAVTHVDPAPEEGAGSLRVTLRLVETRSKSGVSTRDYEEQIWKPGRPWWTSARIPGDIARRSLSQEGTSR